jgi:hypothetical protein
MKYAVEIGSETMLYRSSFIKIGSGIKELKGGGAVHRQQIAWRAKYAK